MVKTLISLLTVCIGLLLSAKDVYAGEVEVLHFWTSPGEAVSVTELKELIARRKHTWKDFAVVGGGGGNAMQALKQRVLVGKPPAAATIKGPAVQEWAALNTLANLDAMATFDHWDQVLPKVVQDAVKHKGRYVAVPANIHRSNWLYSNAEVLRKSGVTAVPTKFDEFLAAAEKIKAAGFIPIAHGGQAWQEFLLFESIVLGVNGVDFYKRAFMDLDPSALNSAEMRRAFDVFRRVKSYTDSKSKGRDWNAATEMVINGKAAFQFMGDWAKGEFVVAGQRPGKEFNCTPAPGTGQAFSYVIDTFAMFQLKSWEAQKAQGYLAYVLLGKEFQEKFNLRKGSIPSRRDMDLSKFDDCAKASARDFTMSEAAKTLVPSVAIDMSVPTVTHAALQAVISDFWNNDAMPSSEAASRVLLAAYPKK
ncbi:ABC transporter substrate-binding protein [Piscinibacter sp. HJYY11]|uniref:ABC transporter substrate-binding protein n=1 Tax=Piscinibacter sp. HJYY11 TaxID=2801333 RepID=UPI0019203610|nr:ABC transporter substrate-binding protein [Piscinibacter sp. HJYY11]MBL0729629.1 carbohydrate ABC transporter substrate-binding protein [Piscinibacter sp. HJYY11]